MAREDHHHWWFKATRRIVSAKLREVLGGRALGRTRILDAGCGTGSAFEILIDLGDLTGVDPSRDALDAAARLGLPVHLVRSPVERLPFSDGSFHMACVLDVLEHLDRDDLALAELRRVLRPDGILFVTVPALPWLWSSHDEALGHRRRYTAASLSRVLGHAGFRIHEISYFNTILLPAMAAYRLGKRLMTRFGPGGVGSDLGLRVPRGLSAAFEATLASERHLLRRLRFPVGASLMAVARPTGGTGA